jgi:hypothetical protein
MGEIRKPRCQTGCLNAAERRDAPERRSNCDFEKAMEGIFNNLLKIRSGDQFDGCLAVCRQLSVEQNL